MSSLLERFCRYVRVESQADEKATTYPSSPGQLVLGKMLADELREMGLRDAEQDAHGIVLATIPATSPRPAPTIAWIAHVDTSPETSGKGVRPQIHANYDGRDIVLPGNSEQVIRVADNPELTTLKGKTIITTDGTTLLGADDKAGVAVIMEAAAQLLARPEVPHGPIRVCFTCDEEIGHGVDHLDLKKLGARVAYTLDGGGAGEIDGETFSADLAVVTVRGINIHPSVGKGRMVNAVRLAGVFLDRLPRGVLSPETTEGREGFLHPYRIEGGVAEVTLRILLRDFDTAKLADRAAVLRSVAATVTTEYPQASIDVKVTPQYRNLADGLAKEPRAMALGSGGHAASGAGEPKVTIVRGGTDGSRARPGNSACQHRICRHRRAQPSLCPWRWTCLEGDGDGRAVAVPLLRTGRNRFGAWFPESPLWCAARLVRYATSLRAHFASRARFIACCPPTLADAREATIRRAGSEDASTAPGCQLVPFDLLSAVPASSSHSPASGRLRAIASASELNGSHQLMTIPLGRSSMRLPCISSTEGYCSVSRSITPISSACRGRAGSPTARPSGKIPCKRHEPMNRCRSPAGSRTRAHPARPALPSDPGRCFPSGTAARPLAAGSRAPTWSAM